MAGFKAALINEMEKLYKKKKGLVALILSLAFIIIGQFSVSVLRKGFGVRGTGSTEFPILILSLFTYTILPLFTALVAIDCFSGEFSHNTMKIAITRPVSRFKFFTAKICSILVFSVANLLLVMIFSIIAGVIFNANSFTFQGILRIIISYLVTIMPMIVLIMVIAFFANIFKNSAEVFFITIVSFVLFKVLGVIFAQYSSLFFTSFMDWYNLWIMDKLPLAKIFREFVLMLSYAIILFTGSFYFFDKKEY